MHLLKASLLAIFLFTSCSESSPRAETSEETSSRSGIESLVDAESPLSDRYRLVENIEDAIHATVKLSYQNATGSGFVVSVMRDDVTNKRVYTVLSAAHIFINESLESAVPLTSKDQSEIVRATFYQGKMRSIRTGKVILLDPLADLALIEIYGKDETDALCKSFWFERGDDYLKYMTDVALIGYPQGIGPIVTTGHISGISVLSWDHESFTTTAQSAPGSSGGPVVNLKTGKVVGMLRAVLRMPNTGQLLTWTSIITPVHTIKDFYGGYLQNLYLPEKETKIQAAETTRGEETPPTSSFAPPTTMNGKVLIFTPNESKQVLYR